MKNFMLGIAFAAAVFAAPAPAHALVIVGEDAPDFTLPDTGGKSWSLSAQKGKHVVLEWTNYDCPFVKKHYDSGNMQSLQKEYIGKGVMWFSVNSSAYGKQGFYKPEKWPALIKEKKSAATAVLLDTEGIVGHSYNASTTPHMFVINPEGKVIYDGAIDDKPTTNVADVRFARNYVKEALDRSMEGKPVKLGSTDSYGCSVKY